MNTANIKFNRAVAKQNFKFADIDELKKEVIKSMLSETGLITAGSRKDAAKILNPDGTLELQQEKVGEAIAFLADETAVSLVLIQFAAHGKLRFVYVVRANYL